MSWWNALDNPTTECAIYSFPPRHTVQYFGLNIFYSEEKDLYNIFATMTGYSCIKLKPVFYT